MNVGETLRIGIRGIRANRLRSSLTVLGILIGVAAVIVLVAVGNGSSVAVAQNIEKLGTNALLIRSGSFGPPGMGGTRGGSSASLTLADAQALVDPISAPDVKQVAPVVQAQGTCVLGDASHATTITGTWPSYFEASNYRLESGSYMTEADAKDGARVAWIGKTVVTQLFGDEDPIGKTITCSGVPLTVQGVFTPKGSSGFQDADDVVVAPLSTVQRQFSGFGSLSSLVVEATSADAQANVQNEVTSILDARHHTTSASRDFQVLNQASLLTATADNNRVFTVLLGAVAAISLLVGGLGIMNIMLVSVTERTREIGIRKAIGASKSAIMGQFLVEATVMSMVGGIAGVVLAFIAVRFSIAGVTPVIVPWSVLGAFLVSIALGLFFGIYPANRAASLRPIEALRHE